jgi:hypothetical protein
MKTKISSMSHELVNLGTHENTKYINLGTCYLKVEKQTYIQLFTKYMDIQGSKDVTHENDTTHHSSQRI